MLRRPRCFTIFPYTTLFRSLNLLQDETFRSGQATVNLIANKPELLNLPRRRDRGTKMLRYLGNVIVNGHEDVKYVDESKSLKSAVVPEFDNSGEYPRGTKQLLTELGPEKFAQWLKGEEKFILPKQPSVNHHHVIS